MTNFINKIYPLLINKLTHKTGLAKLTDQCSADTGSIYTIYENTGKLALSGKIISENTIEFIGRCLFVEHWREFETDI